MKKIVTLLIIILSSLIFLKVNDIYATSNPIEYNFFEINNQASFASVCNAGSCALTTSSPLPIDFDDSYFRINTLMVLGGVEKQVFVPENAKYRSRILITHKDDDGVTLGEFFYTYGDSFDEMILRNPDATPADLSAYKGHKLWFRIAIDNPVISTVEVNTVRTIVNADKMSYFDFRLIYYPIIVDPGIPGDPGNPGQLDMLPETTGSIFDNKLGMGKVTWVVNGYNVQFTIQYLGFYTLNYQFAAGTDMTIFNDAYEAFYYSDDGDKFIVFNQGDQSMFTTNNWKVQTFIPYTIWNLQTNELASFKDFNVYLYAKEESGNNMYAYFYVDEFIIDHLLSVTASMEYRYVPYIGSKGDWVPYFKILEDTTINPGNISWQLTAAAISTVATTIGSMIPGIGLPIFLIGTPITFYLQYLSYQELIAGNSLWTGSIQEIQKVTTPSPSLLSEINSAYQAYYGQFSGINLNNFTLWKLHLGAFNKPLQQGVEINKDNAEGLNILQFRYMTNGQVYTIDGEEINVIFNPGDMSPKDPIIDTDDWLKNLLKDIPAWVLLVAGVLLILLVAPTVDRGASSLSNLFSNRRKAVIVIIIIFVILWFAGVIRI